MSGPARLAGLAAGARARGAASTGAGARLAVERRRVSGIEHLSQPSDDVERDADATRLGPSWSFADVPVSAPPPPNEGPSMPTALGEGRPLPVDVRRAGEARFGADLGAVRVHDDRAGADLAHRAGAEAVTAGTDVAFAPGRFDPNGPVGRQRLTHELTHVVQQARRPGLSTIGLRQPKAGGGTAPAVQPTTLDTLPEKERKSIQVVTTTAVTVPGIDDKFSTKGATTTSAFPANTAMVWDPTVPAALQRGLKNVAGSLSAGNELVPAPLVTNSTITLDLDLRPYGGGQGLYRFTLVAGATPAGPGAAPARILVESLGAAAAPAGTKPPAPTSGPTPTKDPVADKIKDNAIVVSYTGAELDAVRAAIDQVPSAHLAILKGLRFARGTADPTDPRAAGKYDPKTHTITMFDKAFSATQVEFKADGATASSAATRSIVHEIGHAVDLAPLRDAAKVRERADAAVAKLPQDHPDPDNAGGYRWDSRESKADIDKRLADQRSAERTQLSARSRSGSQTVKRGQDLADVVGIEVVKGGFREAAKKDGPKAVSKYGDTDWQENYAEAYSLYLTSPATLRNLRPNVFAYLDRTLPR